MSEEYRNYEEEREKGFETERQLALDDLRPWIESLSEEEVDQPCLIMGHKTFTPRQILKEIEESTEDGRVFVQMLTNHRLELAKREEEIK